jgi:metal-dependent hydrolase (beta-lactamase superfamily II)
MVIYASKGLVVFLGCGHAGLINTLDDAQQIVGPSPIHAAIGRFHLLKASGEHLEWTAKERVDLGLANFIGAHCSGLEPVYRFLELTSLGGQVQLLALLEPHSRSPGLVNSIFQGRPRARSGANIRSN